MIKIDYVHRKREKYKKNSKCTKWFTWNWHCCRSKMVEYQFYMVQPNMDRLRV